MGPETEKCLHDGANDCKSAANYGHFCAKMDVSLDSGVFDGWDDVINYC